MPEDARFQFRTRDLLLVTAACALLFAAVQFFTGETILAMSSAVLLILGAVGLRRGVLRTTAADPQSPRRIASVPNEIDAAVLVEALAAAGIRATAVGGYTSGFRAEAPGEVHIVVAQCDAVRAAQRLAEIPAAEAPVD